MTGGREILNKMKVTSLSLSLPLSHLLNAFSCYYVGMQGDSLIVAYGVLDYGVNSVFYSISLAVSVFFSVFHSVCGFFFFFIITFCFLGFACVEGMLERICFVVPATKTQ